MRLLLDTHVWLWLQLDPGRLAPETLEVLEDEGSDLFLSAASSWELTIKHALGKIVLPEPPGTYVPSRMQRHGIVRDGHLVLTAQPACDVAVASRRQFM